MAQIAGMVEIPTYRCKLTELADVNSTAEDDVQEFYSPFNDIFIIVSYDCV